LANAEDYSSKLSHFDLTSDVSVADTASSQAPGTPVSARINLLGTDEGTSSEQFSPQLERAAVCEESAQRLASLLEQLEESIRSVRLVLNASDAIEQLLMDAVRLLERGRQHSNPVNRKALADAYREIINQIDGIAVDAEFNGQNYATGDLLKVAFDSDGENILKIDNLALTSASLELTPRDINFVADANFIGEMMRIDDALNTVRMRKTFLEMALSVLNSRAKFSQNKMRSLQDASQELTQDGRAHMAIQEVAARRIAMDSTKISIPGYTNNTPSKADSKLFENDNNKNNNTANIINEHLKYNDDNNYDISEIEDIQCLINNLGTEKLSELNLLAMELARFLDEETYMRQWLKFENGEADRFVIHLANSYGPEIIEKAKDKYAEDKKFKSNSDLFRQIYEKMLEEEVSEDPNPKAKMDSFLKTNYGTIYIILTRAAGIV